MGPGELPRRLDRHRPRQLEGHALLAGIDFLGLDVEAFRQGLDHLLNQEVGRGGAGGQAHGGDMRISSYDEEVVRQIGLGEEIMDEYRDTFRALAK